MNGIQTVLTKLFEHGAVYFKIAFLIMAIYGFWKYFIVDDKSLKNISAFIFGSSMIGAYSSITKIIVDLAK